MMGILTEKLEQGARPIFHGRYEFVRSLGRGGCGEVFLANDLMLDGEQIAIKILHPELSRDERFKKRFLREVILARKLSHPNIIRTFDVGEDEGVLYLTMEYLEGETLKERMTRGDISFEDSAHIFLEILRGLAVIHEAQVVHRDLKPGNIIISGKRARITDFGIARPAQSELTGQHEVLGSTAYMAPEVWTGRDIGPPSDLYALGVILYEMLTGILPFDGESPAELMCKHLELKPTEPKQIVATVPTWLNALTMALLAKDHEARSVNTSELAVKVEEQIALGFEDLPETEAYQAEVSDEEDHVQYFSEAPSSAGMQNPQFVPQVDPAEPIATLTDAKEHGLKVLAQSIPWLCGLASVAVLVLSGLAYVAPTVVASSYEFLKQFSRPFALIASVILPLLFAASAISLPIMVLGFCCQKRWSNRMLFERGFLLANLLVLAFFVRHSLSIAIKGHEHGYPFQMAQVWAALSAAISNSLEVAFLFPYGTTYAATSITESVTLVPLKLSASGFDFLYLLVLVGFALGTAFVFRKETNIEFLPKPKVLGPFFAALVAGVSIGSLAGALLGNYVPVVFRLNAGLHVFSVDLVQLLSGIFTWALLSATVLVIWSYLLISQPEDK